MISKMRKNLHSKWINFHIWYMINRIDDLVDLSFKVAKFFGCFIISSLLVMGGTMYLQELWGLNSWSPIMMILQFIGFYVMLIGAATVAKS